MSDEFGPNFITITDEDGNDIELEYVDALEHNGVTYMAFFPHSRHGGGSRERPGFWPGDSKVRNGKRRGAAGHPRYR